MVTPKKYLNARNKIASRVILSPMPQPMPIQDEKSVKEKSSKRVISQKKIKKKTLTFFPKEQKKLKRTLITKAGKKQAKRSYTPEIIPSSLDKGEPKSEIKTLATPQVISERIIQEQLLPSPGSIAASMVEPEITADIPPAPSFHAPKVTSFNIKPSKKERMISEKSKAHSDEDLKSQLTSRLRKMGKWVETSEVSSIEASQNANVPKTLSTNQTLTNPQISPTKLDKEETVGTEPPLCPPAPTAEDFKKLYAKAHEHTATSQKKKQTPYSSTTSQRKVTETAPLSVEQIQKALTGLKKAASTQKVGKTITTNNQDTPAPPLEETKKSTQSRITAEVTESSTSSLQQAKQPFQQKEEVTLQSNPQEETTIFNTTPQITSSDSSPISTDATLTVTHEFSPEVKSQLQSSTPQSNQELTEGKTEISSSPKTAIQESEKEVFDAPPPPPLPIANTSNIKGKKKWAPVITKNIESAPAAEMAQSTAPSKKQEPNPPSSSLLDEEAMKLLTKRHLKIKMDEDEEKEAESQKSSSETLAGSPQEEINIENINKKLSAIKDRLEGIPSIIQKIENELGEVIKIANRPQTYIAKQPPRTSSKIAALAKNFSSDDKKKTEDSIKQAEAENKEILAAKEKRKELEDKLKELKKTKVELENESATLSQQLKNIEEKESKASEIQKKLKAKAAQQTGGTLAEEITRGVMLKRPSHQKENPDDPHKFQQGLPKKTETKIDPNALAAKIEANKKKLEEKDIEKKKALGSGHADFERDDDEWN